MFEFMKNLLSDKDTGTFTFEAFSLSHIIYLVLIIAAITFIIFVLRNKSQETKGKIVNITVTTALCLYIADFFLMPFSQGQVDIDKLPFHLCTSMSILCVLSRNTKLFTKFKTSFTLLGLIGAIMYIVYPSGVASADGYSYRIIQTVLYHGLMIAQGVFAIAFKDIDINWKNFKYDIIVILCLTLWAMLGNLMYSGTVEAVCECHEGCTEVITTYNHSFNWFFVKHDALYIIPDEIDIYFAPFIMIFAITGMCALIRFLGILLLNKFSKTEITE